MARLTIDIGTLGNPATGDTLRGAMEKINTNFTEVYSLVRDGSSGLIATDVTNGDLKIQSNGTGIVEIDNLQINGDAITSITTNASVDITGNGTGGVNIEALSFNGTSVSSTDSSTINLNDNVTVDGDLAVSGTITGTFSVSAVGDITAVGSTLSTPSNADLTLSPGGTGAVVLPGITINDNNITGTRSNDDINITSSGTGNVNLNGDTVRVGDNDADATITTQGTGDLTLSTNGGTNSGTIIIRDGSNGDIILEPDGTGDVLLKGDKVGIGTVNQPDTLLHLKDTNAVITLQRTADANTPGISFQQSGGNVRGVIKLDGTSGTSNEIFMQTYDGASLAERFRVTHTGAKVSGTLNVDDGISITDNTITTSASNANLELTASGTGAVKVDAILSLPDGSDSDNYVGVGDADDLKIFHNGSHSIIRETGTGSLYIQSDNNVIIGKDSSSETMIKGVADGAVELYHDNVKKLNTSSSGVTVVDELHTEGATPHLTLKRTDNANVPTLRFKGSGGTVGASMDFQGTGGVSNELAFQVFDGASLAERFRVSYTGAKVTGTLDIDGGVSITDNTITSSASNADLEINASGTGTVVLENLKVGTGATVTTILDEDNMASNSATALATQQSIKAYVDTEISGVSTASIGDITFVGSTISSPSNADITLSPGGTGAVVLPAITINDNNITSTRSNDDIVLKPNGTGQVVLNQIKSDDSSMIIVNDGLDINGNVQLGDNNELSLGDSGDLVLYHNGGASVIRDAGTGSLILQTADDQRVTDLAGTTFSAKFTPTGAAELYHNGTKRFETTASGIYVPDVTQLDRVVITDNEITTNATNTPLELNPNGTGNIIAQRPLLFNAGYIEKINTLTSSSTITVDCSAASIHKVTLATSTEFNISNLPTGGTVTLIITQDGSGSRTATFGTDGSTAVKFPGGAPTLSTGAGDIDVVTIVNDGTNFLGNCAKNYS